VPVYDTFKEAALEHPEANASISFVPAPFLLDAALEAIDSGVSIYVMVTDLVPLLDAVRIINFAERRGVQVIGPNTAGVTSPGKCKLGIHPVHLIKPGSVGVMSRSGGQTSTVPWAICREGLGISTAVHVGTEVIIGTTAAEYLQLFENDKETDLVVMFGEIGGVMESEVAEVIKGGEYTKPFVVYIAGRTLPAGIRFSHASAIVQRGRDTAESKMAALRDAGGHIVEKPKEIASTVVEILKR